MLSKSTGQVLRVAAGFNILFNEKTEKKIGTKAVVAAINFVEVCCQHTAYMADRGQIDDEIVTGM